MGPSASPTRPLDAGCIKHAAFEYYGRLGKVKSYVVHNHSEDITLRSAANIACLEEKYFSCFFHEKTGVRFVDFVSYVRVEHAKNLLQKNDASILKISATVGYHNRRTFERAFKKWTGVAPREFRITAGPR